MLIILIFFSVLNVEDKLYILFSFYLKRNAKIELGKHIIISEYFIETELIRFPLK